MRISDWSSDVCSSDLPENVTRRRHTRSRNRAVTAINDEYLDLDAAERDGVVGTDDGVGGESALLAALNAARTGHMNDIVETKHGSASGRERGWQYVWI